MGHLLTHNFNSVSMEENSLVKEIATLNLTEKK